MKKAEMEAHHAQYRACIVAAQSAESRGMYRLAIQSAVAACEHIDGMLQYDRKYGNQEHTSLLAFDLILKYAPLLLDISKLAELATLVDDCARIQKGIDTNVGDLLAGARARLWENHRLFSHLERHPGDPQESLQQRLGGDQNHWRSVAEGWSRMGLLNRVPAGSTYRLSLSTQTGQLVAGKCPCCGHVAEAPKGMFLEEASCPECSSRTLFVLLPDERDTAKD